MCGVEAFRLGQTSLHRHRQHGPWKSITHTERYRKRTQTTIVFAEPESATQSWSELEIEVPKDQRPINELEQLKTSFLYSWGTLDTPEYIKKLSTLWAGMFALVGCPIAYQTFSPSDQPVEFFLSGATGALIVVAIANLRIFLGWKYVADRLMTATLPYEETGWYDGQFFVKPPEILTRDRLLGVYEARPVLNKLKTTLQGTGALLLTSAITLSVAISSSSDADGVYGRGASRITPDGILFSDRVSRVQDLYYDDEAAAEEAAAQGDIPGYCRDRYFKSVSGGESNQSTSSTEKNNRNMTGLLVRSSLHKHPGSNTETCGWKSHMCSHTRIRPVIGASCHTNSTRSQCRISATTNEPIDVVNNNSEEVSTDIVVIGSGIGGLCCAALLARAGYSVVVCESHYHPGGAAHAFEVDGYMFDAGPSFHAGLSGPPGQATNPLKQVLDAIDERVECTTYDRWITYTPEGDFPCVCDREEYIGMIRRIGGETAYSQWLALEEKMKPLQKGASLFPAAAIRSDIGIILTAMQFGPGLLSTGLYANQLTGPFGDIVNQVVTDPWLKNFLDLECFVLSGMKAKDTIAAEMAFMFMERNGGESTIDYPMGGGGAIVDALTRGIEKYNGTILLSTHVDKVMIENGRATGVHVNSKTSKHLTTIKARKAVVSNASVWDTAKLLQASGFDNTRILEEKSSTPTTGSFMHLHLGIDATDLPRDLDCHHLIVNHWDDIEAPQNVCIISIPSVFDSSLAPPGKAVVHAYTAGNEPWSVWKNVRPGSPEYKALKKERTQVLWKALERVIPDIRQRAEVVLEGSPHTHARFLRRHQGTYGPAISARKSSFPGPTSWPITSLYTCGDSCMPGIGVPAAAASGMIVANTLTPIRDHLNLIASLQLIPK